MKEYYTVIGKSAVAVAVGWEEAQRLHRLIRKSRYKGYASFEEASDDLLQYLCENGYRFPMEFYPNKVWYLCY